MPTQYKIQVYTHIDGWVDAMRLLDMEKCEMRVHVFKNVELAEYAWEMHRRGFRYDENKAPVDWMVCPIIIGNDYRIVDADTEDGVWPQ